MADARLPLYRCEVATLDAENDVFPEGLQFRERLSEYNATNPETVEKRMERTLVLVHGYSDKESSFDPWVKALTHHGLDVAIIHACSYETLSNEVSLRDIAEGFDRALGIEAGLANDEDFDVIVHSTGMLVVRAWLSHYAKRRKRLKHLIGLAPASFGSPHAHKGRSWLGAIFKGQKKLGPDFLEAGDKVLDALELGSRFTWDLAHRDLLGANPTFGPNGDTPYVYIFCGTQNYHGLRSLVNEPGTDGTVRWAGCSLNTRKINLDLTVNDNSERITTEPWCNQTIPLVPIHGLNHGSILSQPTGELIELTLDALKVSNQEDHERWVTKALESTKSTRSRMRNWQQFVIRALDERGEAISDYNVQLFSTADGKKKGLREFDLDVHAYSSDKSLRCFHVDLDRVKPETIGTLQMRLLASSGSQLVGYHGFGASESGGAQSEGDWDAEIDLSSIVAETGVKFFYPFTTTSIEIRSLSLYWARTSWSGFSFLAPRTCARSSLNRS